MDATIDAAMDAAAQTETNYLAVQAGDTRCALPLTHVIETLRLSHIDTTSAHNALAGTALVRGQHLPVFHLAAALGIHAHEEANRLVHVRLSGASEGDTEACLLVHAVEGVRRFDAVRLGRFTIAPHIHSGLAALLAEAGAIPQSVTAA